MRPKYLVTILVLLALAAPASTAHAGGLVSICDEAHLLTALAGGGTVTFSCSGTIILTAEITIAADTTIDGSGQTVTISGNNIVRVFTVNSGVTLNLDELTVADGSAGEARGGGIYNRGNLNVNNSTFSGNSASNGGGISTSGLGSTVTVSNSTLSDNTASLNGGGISNDGTVTVSNSTFSGNWATGAGGGIYSSYRLTVSNSTFDHNQASNGGGIVNNGTVTVSNGTLSGNNATYFGGGILNWSGGRVTISNSTLSGNSADAAGGIYNDQTGTLTVSSSTFSDNIAYGAHYGNGGGIRNGGTVEVSNSTFSDNSAYGVGGEGGGIYNDSSSIMAIVSNSTFSGNSAYEGGGIHNRGYSLMLRNTIVANSLSGGNCAGTITDGGGNLSYPDAICPGINGNPLLGPLQINGGPTHTMEPGPGSAALDAANDAICAAAPINNLDQRGVARPQGSHCDIGAVERLPFRIWLAIAYSR